MRKRIIWKFFGAFAFLTFIAVFVLNFTVGVRLQDDFEEKISQELRSNAILVGEILKDDVTQNRLQTIQKRIEDLAGRLQLRITVVSSQGRVMADSAEDPPLMENHSDRPEITDALRNGSGQSTRPSDTLGYNMKYVAVRVSDGGKILGVVRFALPLSKVQLERRLIYRVVLLGALVSIAISLTVAWFVSRSITSPIGQMQQAAERIAGGDFSCRVKIAGADELARLAKSLNMMADELQQKIENLKQMDQIRTDFVANVSHELKTPLTLIRGYIETLEGKALENREKARRFVSIIKEHTERLGNIIDDLLRLSELELSRDCIQKTDCDLKRILEDVTLGFGHALDNKNQTLTINARGDNFKINADVDKIEQVFVNLVDNAIKYTQQDGRIEVILTDHEDKVTADVRDNGIGIESEHLDRVFERFYRVDKARSRELGGTGLGLGIAKHIVLAHNGNISIESDVGRGTTVSVTLPRS